MKFIKSIINNIYVFQYAIRATWPLTKYIIVPMFIIGFALGFWY